MIKRGGLYWDRDTSRPKPSAAAWRVQAAIKEAGDEAWVMYGDSQRYGPVAYMGHFLPRARSALVLVPREGPPVMLASVGARDTWPRR